MSETMTETEAARRAFELVVETVGINPERVAQAERQRDQLLQIVDLLPEVQKRDMLVRATAEGNDGGVEQLLATGGDPHAAASEEAEAILRGHSALSAAARCWRPRALEIFLAHGADLRSYFAAEGFAGSPALSWTVNFEASVGDLVRVQDGERCVDLLLKAGADKDARDDYGATALLVAVFHNHEWAVKMLLEAGCDVDLASIRGFTPLMWAAENGNLDIAKILIDAGASKTLVDVDGNTVLQHAREERHTQIAALLRE